MMTNNRRARYWTVLYTFIIISQLEFDSVVSSAANCPVEADPATILSCVAIDAVGLVQATKGNVRVFCAMAERFMECVKTKTRGCIGEEFVRGSLSELIELSQKCCVNKNEKLGDECPFTTKPQCFSLDGMTTSATTGNEISIGNLTVGDTVLALDENEEIISTSVVAILHYNNDTKVMFYTFTMETGHQLSLTPEHLVYVGNQSFIPARDVNLKEHNLFVIGKNGSMEPSRIRSIDIQLKHGYATPITQHGTLLVNGVGSSCYASVYDHGLAHMAMAPLRWLHGAKKIFRLTDTKTTMKNGIHWYPRTLNNFVHMFVPFPGVFTTTPGKL